VNTSSPSLLGRLQNMNPFGSGGYVRLPTSENPGAPLPAPTRREEEEGWFARKSIFVLYSGEDTQMSWASSASMKLLWCATLSERHHSLWHPCFAPTSLLLPGSLVIKPKRPLWS
jgi:hypothetical protein